MLRKLFCEIVLIADKNPTLVEKGTYSVKVIGTFAPIAYILSELGLWFADNHKFCTFVISAVVINAGVGMWYHSKNNSFNYEQFLKKNSVMMLVIIISYILLEQLRITAGDNISGEVFKIMIQLATLLYPTSKAFKNIFILSNGEFPPEWIMRRLYNFKQSGNLAQFFETSHKAADYKDEIDEMMNDLKDK